MPSARERTEEAIAALDAACFPEAANVIECADAASDVWEPKLRAAIELLEKYERVIWLRTHGSEFAYRDSHDLWTLKEFVNG